MTDKEKKEEFTPADSDKETEKLLQRAMKPATPPAVFEAKLKQSLFSEWSKAQARGNTRGAGFRNWSIFSWFQQRTRPTQAGIVAAAAIIIVAAIIGFFRIPHEMTPVPPLNNYVEPGQIIQAAVGKPFTITVEENQSTGYRWEAQFDADYLEFVGSKYEPASVEKPAGAGGNHLFKFKPVKIGEAEITLVLRRSQEAPLDTKIFKVKID